jgi:RNA polymerase primary sigma factor
MSEEDLKIFTKEVLKRFSSIKRSHNKLEALRKQKKWMDDPEYKKHQDSIVKVLVNFRFSSKFVEVLCDKIRIFIKNIRHHEKEIMEFCVMNQKCQGDIL